MQAMQAMQLNQNKLEKDAYKGEYVCMCLLAQQLRDAELVEFLSRRFVQNFTEIRDRLIVRLHFTEHKCILVRVRTCTIRLGVVA